LYGYGEDHWARRYTCYAGAGCAAVHRELYDVQIMCTAAHRRVQSISHYAILLEGSLVVRRRRAAVLFNEINSPFGICLGIDLLVPLAAGPPDACRGATVGVWPPPCIAAAHRDSARGHGETVRV
jgi:hypothetical protein